MQKERTKTKVSAPGSVLDNLDLSLGKRTRLYRLLYQNGLKNGTLLFLPIDQGVEHGPRDFFANPSSVDPEFQLKIALEGGFNGVVFHYGLAAKYMKDYVGKVPLILKLNGKTDIPSDSQPFSGLTGTIEDALRLGADAIGYTMYVGSPRQDEDFRQFVQLRNEADRYGMPVIMWSYPRGEAIENKGGRNSLYAVDYAARIANELGADIVKLNFPEYDAERNKMCPKPYNKLKLSPLDEIKKIVRSAGKTLVIISGGGKMSDEALLEKASLSMEGGVTGLIFGRNIWQRKYKEALAITEKIKNIMKKYPK